ncbi:hypothetical protein B0T17DRAFT_486286 [Bombardia bombarda]|uniref:Adenosine deaminase domain-containing protein n=1 Tax=Bombardia bombarda TaxID=252184 RepID=A0AA39X8Y2_9PEZI|nr:hypothetical protein B0T17DRAFT_486286 [Bombardia bombarda]
MTAAAIYKPAKSPPEEWLSIDKATDEAAYDRLRNQVTDREDTLAFDFLCKTRASPDEIRANEILQLVKKLDINEVYTKAPKNIGYGGQVHDRFFGDHFLSNADLIEETKLFAISRRMPKGAHLHIHFNANLLPHVLIDIAKQMPCMYITSDIPLVRATSNGASAFDTCKIQFNILSTKLVNDTGKQNLFSTNYTEEKRHPMPIKEFFDQFPEAYLKARGESLDADTWLRNKVVFQEEEAYHLHQTAEGAWKKFNGRTQLMKGLFNYETAYKEYTTQCLQEFVDDNIQYAEIRPNFMPTNQVWKDDGSIQLPNKEIVELIIARYNLFQETHKGEVLKGLKIIYCTPRSFDDKAVKNALEECLRFHKEFPGWIAGFDLVGEEAVGRPLKDFIPLFLHFKAECKKQGVDIPFLFHCGETLDIGKHTDGNLVDALLLGSKRIGHGFALARHPYIMEQMKKRGICIEVCPISNEVLGLTPRMNGHTVYSLLANNVHCTVSTDNGTLFRSRLSHDFYQMMAGKQDMTLHGWRQLIEWSLDHSCLESDKRDEIYAAWVIMWDDFCKWIIDTYEEETKDFKPEDSKPEEPRKPQDSVKL